MSGYNPLLSGKKKRTAGEILSKNFKIGISDFDRGASVWVEKREGKGTPGWVHVPKVSLECVIRFKVNIQERGTGCQLIPASEFLACLDAFDEIIKRDYKVLGLEDRTKYVPTNERIESSFKMVRPKHLITNLDGKKVSVDIPDSEETVVSVNCSGGSGSKPMLVPRSEFQDVVSLLRTVGDELPGYIESAKTRYANKVNDDVF